jgi:hypothetical protein
VDGLAVRFGDNAQPTLTFLHSIPKPQSTVGLTLLSRWRSKGAADIGKIDTATVRPSHQLPLIHITAFAAASRAIESAP